MNDMTNTARVGAVILLMGIGAIVVGSLVDPNSTNALDVILIFYANVGSELISIAITVLIIDRLSHRRDQAERQQELEDNKQLQQRIAHDLARQLRNYMQGQALSRLRQCHDTSERQPVLDEMAQNNLLKGLDLSHTDLQGAGFWGARMDGIRLRGCNLTYAKMKNARLNRADLREVQLSFADLRKATFTGAQFAGADLHHSRLENTDMSELDLYQVRLSEALLRKTDFSRANLQSVDIQFVHAEEATFGYAKMIGAQCTGGVFTGATFTHADLRGASFRDAILTDATLTHCDLRGADFTQADLTGANLKHAQGVTVEQLSAAASCEGLVLPDGRTLPPSEGWRKALAGWAG